jgi:hypothetical protein
MLSSHLSRIIAQQRIAELQRAAGPSRRLVHEVCDARRRDTVPNSVSVWRVRCLSDSEPVSQSCPHPERRRQDTAAQ